MKKVVPSLMILMMVFGFVSISFAAALMPPQHQVSTMGFGIAPGWYLGLGLGYGGMDTPKIATGFKEESPIIGVEETRRASEELYGFAGRAYGGYLWALSNHPDVKYGIEMGYALYESNRYKILSTVSLEEKVDSLMHTWKYKGYNIDLLAVARYNISRTGWNVFGKAGLAYVEQKYTYSYIENIDTLTLSDYRSNTRHKILPKAMLGVGYDFTPNFGISITGDYIFGRKPHDMVKAVYRSDYNKVAPVYMFLLNGTWHFA